MKKEIHTKEAPQAIGPYSQAILTKDHLFISGQIGLDPKTGKLVGDTIQEQTRQVLKNIEAILQEAGLVWKNIVRTEIYLIDLWHFEEMNAVYQEVFSEDPKPARHAVEVRRLPKDALVEIVCVAVTLVN